MVDREARNKLKQALSELRIKQTYTLAFLAETHPKTKDISIKYLWDELYHRIVVHLPYEPDGDHKILAIQELTPILERTELFLQTDHEYGNPDEKWNCLSITMLVGVLGGAASALLGIGGEGLYPSIQYAAKWGVAIGIACLLTPVTMALFADLLIGAERFRVHVIRQNYRRSSSGDDYWPFIGKNSYEIALKSHQ